MRKIPRDPLSYLSPWIPAVVFVAAVSLLGAWRYSALGFNPTDDGFVLAYARRILDGQVPHRDFIAIHLAGSGYLHAPFVALGGNHTYLTSRVFVWLQLGVIAWGWTNICARRTTVRLALATQVLLALISLALSVHYFPDMAWHTIDGLFLITLGEWLRQANSRSLIAVGNVLLGAAILCKQNFVFCVPLILLLDERDRLASSVLAVLLLPAAYALGVVLSGGADDAWIQLTTQSDLATPGFYKYLWEPAFAGGVVLGLLTTVLLMSRAHDAPLTEHNDVARLAGLSIVLLLVVAACNAMTQGRYLGSPAFGVFGLAGGTTLALATLPSMRPLEWKNGLIVVAVGWCTALSIGYNTPALAAGIAVTFLLRVWLPRLEAPRRITVAASMLVGVVALWCAISLDQARFKFVYLEGPAYQLTWGLDGVLPGGAGLRTDATTYLVLRDLHQLTSSNIGDYAILPDFAGWWPAAAQANPLPIDWSQWIELGSPALRARAIAAMDAQRGRLTFVVAKYETARLAKRLTPAPPGFRYPLAAYARAHYTKVGETPFFELYR